MAAGWRVEVDGDRCVGTGACEYTAPDIFEVGDDAVATVIGEPDGSDQRVRDAVDECPAAALRLIPPGE